MANFTGTYGSEEFAGDEFSNNLFSDLAPLLTLFGEQVTKQFLSMSLVRGPISLCANIDLSSPLAGMGWADNVLLAMGPLGIMTIVVSAIRVGRVKMLKAMVGRARESQSDAEQELLSSTSEDVCELWSGHEVVRVMGQPAGMKTLIIFDKKVCDLKSAVNLGLLRRFDIDDEDLDSLTNAAPNLTLNVRDATAGPRELWTWAAVGAILQIIAIVIPGIATYVWQWPKADVKVQSYGYPCFVIGTLLVVLGTMVCGHVIEGVTTEHNFTMRPLSDLAPRLSRSPAAKMQVVRLQRACTVSDQHFSSYAIFNDEDNHSIRTSRLNTADYGTLAAVSSLVSVVGFIIQFVGLRALHWSATIIQLGITIIMTGIRAWARRGLAFDPETHVILDGHEIAWLVLHLVSKERESCRSSCEDVSENHDAPRNQDVLKTTSDAQALGTKAEHASWPENRQKHWDTSNSRLQDFWNMPFDETSQNAKEFIWEPIVGYDSYRQNGINPLRYRRLESASDLVSHAGISRENIYMFQQFFLPLRFDGIIGVELTDQLTSDQNEDDALNLYKQIAKRTMNILCDVNAIDWKKGGIIIKQTDVENDLLPGLEEPGDKVSEVFWGFTISMRMPHEEQAQTKRLYSRMARVVDDPNASGLRTGPVRWQLQDRELIVGVLSLWLYSMARRRIAIEKFNEPIEKMLSGDMIPITFGKIGRIIGTGSVGHRRDIHHPLSPWLGVPIIEMPLPDGLNSFSDFLDEVRTEATWFLGMFLSSMAQADTDPSPLGQDASRDTDGNLSVQTRDDSSLEIHFAQELLSLFVLAMASNIGKVLGKTVYDRRRHNMAIELRQPAVCLENSVFNAIADEIVNGGLAHNTREAYSLIIPAFHKFDILPKPEDTEVF
ncbi:hypothetical protein G7054_g7472 [Neopestalotiopsis clavispora]|nr:hypothetical protein G7054_g7472 [Neopestalotiopsis clavispora]